MYVAVTRVTTFLERAATYANAVGTLVVLLLVAVVNVDVVARGVFNAPFRGAVEVVQFSMVLIVFLQLPDVVRVDRLTRSDGFLAVVGNRWPRLQSLLNRLIDCVSAVLMTLIAVALAPEFLDAWETQYYFGTPGIFTAPWWPLKLAILLSAGMCAALFGLRALFGRRARPVTKGD